MLLSDNYDINTLHNYITNNFNLSFCKHTTAVNKWRHYTNSCQWWAKANRDSIQSRFESYRLFHL